MGDVTENRNESRSHKTSDLMPTYFFAVAIVTLALKRKRYLIPRPNFKLCAVSLSICQTWWQGIWDKREHTCLGLRKGVDYIQVWHPAPTRGKAPYWISWGAALKIYTYEVLAKS